MITQYLLTTTDNGIATYEIGEVKDGQLVRGYTVKAANFGELVERGGQDYNLVNGIKNKIARATEAGNIMVTAMNDTASLSVISSDTDGLNLIGLSTVVASEMEKRGVKDYGGAVMTPAKHVLYEDGSPQVAAMTLLGKPGGRQHGAKVTTYDT